MPRTLEQKKAVVAGLREDLAGAETLLLTDFTGLDVEAMTELRSRLREEGIGYRVAKNTLMHFAVEELDLPGLDEYLQGPTGVVLGSSDPVVPAKIIKEFAKDHDDRPAVKIGVVDRRLVSAGDVAKLAELPTREELLGSIMGSLTSSVAGMVGVLEGLLRDIAHMAHEAAEKREAGKD